MTKSIVVAFHKYQPYGGEYYEPILDFFLQSMQKYKNEYDRIYIIDSNWNIRKNHQIHINVYEDKNISILQVNPSLRYYEAYKEVLPQIQEDLVLFMDNDMVVYREGIIRKTFDKLDSSLPSVDVLGHDNATYDVVSIYDTIGDYKTDRLHGKNKFCPYWFAAKKELLMQYQEVDWGSHMPHSETLGKLTEAMLNDGVESYEWEEDKSSLLFDGSESYPNGTGRGKDLGYMHVRAGSTLPVLLAWKKEGSEEYQKYLDTQPKSEYLRQACWYQYMGGDPTEVCSDVEITKEMWDNYYNKALVYYGLT